MLTDADSRAGACLCAAPLLILTFYLSACSAGGSGGELKQKGGSGGVSGQGGGGAGGSLGGTGGGGAGGGTGGTGGQGGGGSGGVGGSGGSGGASGMAGTAGGGAGGGGAHDYEVTAANWYEDRNAAYSIIHDDQCNVQVASLQNDKVTGLLAARGLRASFGAIVQYCEMDEFWPVVNAVAAAGHEVLNHSWDHTDHVLAQNLAVQMDQADAALRANVTAQAPTFYIFPFDSYDAATLEHAKALGYLGARGGTKGLVNPPDYADDFRLNFDVFGPGYSAFCDDGVCATEMLMCCGVTPTAPFCTDGSPVQDQGSDACKDEILRAYVDVAIASNGWAIREFHGVDDGWEEVPQARFEAHLDYVKGKSDSGELWVATPTPIIKYRRTRQYCTGSVDGSVYVFDEASAECQKYASPLTLRVRPTDPAHPPTLTATQANSTLPVRTNAAGEFVVTLDPLAGDVTFSK